MYAIQMTDITKTFGDLVANDKVNFELISGEIHALLGENGAGKTTLMRILYGLYNADSGTIYANEKPVTINTPRDAIANGIGMVTQHFTLVPTLTVAENLVLGEKGSLQLDIKNVEKRVKEASDRFGIQVKPDALVRHLSVGERQRVEILKALYRNAKVLILDEPTAVLVPQEVDALFVSLERLRKEGLSIIFISHKLNEVMTICDRITVLRNGKFIGTVDKKATTKTDLARMMVGRETFGIKRQGEHEMGEVVVQVENVSVLDSKNLLALRNVSFEVYAGEILGVAGVSGNGQTELTQVLSGLLAPSEGKVTINGKDLTGKDASAMVSAGVGRIPEDRHASVFGELTVAENMVIEQIDEFVHSGILDRKKITDTADKLIKDYQIKAKPSDKIRTLSGGNMQKVILSRILYREPKFILASQPTRGLDLGATEYVDMQLLEQRDRNAAVLLLSEDLEEIMALSDRVAVIYEGKIVKILPIKEATREKLGLLMSGSALAEEEAGEISN